MNTIKRRLLPALCAAALLVLSACGVNRDDITTYIQGELDCTYKGIISEDYVALVDGMTEADAQTQYENNVTAEAERMLYFLEVLYYEEETASEEVMTRAEELVKEIYSHAQYTVNQAEKLQSGDFAVEVIVSPIELFPLLTADDYSNIWTEVCNAAGIYDQEGVDALSDEERQEVEAQYALRMMDRVEELLPQLSYGQDQSVMLQMELSDNTYTLVSNSWANLDNMIIDYSGTYM